MTNPKTGWIPLWNSSGNFSQNYMAGTGTNNDDTENGTGVQSPLNGTGATELGSESHTVENDSETGAGANDSASKAKPSRWLSWRGSTPDSEHTEALIVREEQSNDEEHPDNDLVPDDNGDEVEDSSNKKKASSWSFWNSTTTANVPPKNTKIPEIKEDKKPKIHPHYANTIVSSTHPLTKDGTEEYVPETPDDAVLYKPHDTSRQFNQINTHKNENISDNIIVPDWDSCLPTRRSSIVPLLVSDTTSNAYNSFSPKMDIKNWRQYLNSLSSKLGFGSQSLTSVVKDQFSPNDNQVEQEINLLYEKTYRLYGKSLTKLPHYKRACLPNYNKQFEPANQLEDDATDPNSISITDDAMGNLLINHKRTQQSQQSHTISSNDIVSQSTGGLKKIKRILIIGVHGFFPTKMIRPIIGSPKGTSLKFANEAEKAVIRYCLENNIINKHESNDISIQKIALEKEGKIFDRVGFFMEILRKWAKELNEADCIFIAAHSQGCVVTIILLARLLKYGILKDPYSKRIGILGMCGINNGPFYGFDKSFFMKAYSTIEHDSMMELFELTKFDSEHSLEYKESIQIIINVNVKICFIGSVNDQLVPLYSALASHVFHPNIYRACYMDNSAQTPPFIEKLVSLCCHLQNIGYFDNNVLKELSSTLAGPMTGGGHSKIYNDGKVYDLGIRFLLDTDDIIIPSSEGRFLGYEQQEYHDIYGLKNYGRVTDDSEPVQQILKLPVTNQVYIKEYNVGKIGSNPFILPWCLRGLMFNIEKNWPNTHKLLTVDSGKDMAKNGYDEINELYDLFENWKPDSKQMKDLKYRLNGIRASKL